ncbi:ribosome biogenesis GTPase A [Deltaproteobacteria bacterium]|nr:ribosome biogenesis GTPase A [Deltaproteobacteria bacterium]
MATARKEIKKTMPGVDLVIEVLDARIPFSSENPMVSGLRGEKPCIQILNKCDLADPDVTAEWLRIISATPGVRAITHHNLEGGFLRTLNAVARELVPPIRTGPMTAMILGIPNVGKSTLINALASRSIAKSANKPAITTRQQRINVGTDLVLLDTPGFLWPKLTPAACGYRLAVTGAISDRVVDYQDIATFAAKFLTKRYAAPVATFYGLGTLPADPNGLVEAIGRKRGFLGKGSVVDLQRAAERLIHDLREGRLGRISLETPGDCGLGASSP